MSLTVKSRIGKKHTIYLPKRIVEALDIKEGQKILLDASGDSLTLRLLKDPLELALSENKFASITSEKIEAISLEEQAAHLKSSP